MKMQNLSGTASLLLACTFLVACNQQTVPGATAAPGPAAAPASVAAVTLPVPVCNACGIVRSITAINQDGAATGAGAVIGGIVGGVAGNQVGGGSGRKIATAAGVIGGAVLGNEIEQNRNAATVYEVVVDMEGGGQQVLTLASTSGFSTGSQVRVQGGGITLR